MSAAEWTPLATGVVAAVALVVGVLTVRQKSVSDRRAQWWERVQWAVEQTLHESEERRLIGVVVLAELADTDQPTRDEVRIIDALADVLLAEPAQNEDHGDRLTATAEES